MNRCMLIIISVTAMVFYSSDSALGGETDSIRVLTEKVDSLRKSVGELKEQLEKIDRPGGRGWRSLVRGEIRPCRLSSEGERPYRFRNDRARRRWVNALPETGKEQPGELYLNGGVTTILQGNPDDRNGYLAGAGSFDIYAHTTLGSHTLLFIDLEGIGGRGADYFSPTSSGLNDDAGSYRSEDGIDRINVLEAWAEFDFFEQRLKVTAGKIDLTNYFDNSDYANDETTQFISGALVNSSALAVPDNSAGVRAKTTLLEGYYLQLALASCDNAGGDLLEGVLGIGSVGVRLFPDSGHHANLRLYLYQHPSEREEAGYGASYDQLIIGNFGIFGRYGRNTGSLADYHGTRSAWSAGLNYSSQLYGCSTEAGIAYSESRHSDKSLKDEKLMEGYYRFGFNEWIYLSPHLQIVQNQEGSSQRLTVVGLRTHFCF